MKWMVRFFGGLVALLAAAAVTAVIVLKNMDFNAYRGLIHDEVKATTGRDLTIVGNLSLDISLTPSLVVENVKLANAPWGARADMVVLKRLAAEVRLIPLLGGNVRINRLVLNGLDVLLEVNERGLVNWDLAPAAKPASAPVAPAIPLVDKVLLNNLDISYHDARNGTSLKVAVQSLDLQAKETKGPLTFILKASLAGTPIGASGQIGNIEQFLAAGGHYPIRFEVQASGIKADVNGIVDTPRAPKGVDFKIAAKTANLSGANALLKAVTAASEGRSLPAIPLDASLRLRGQGEGYGLDDIKIKAGRSDLSGAVRVGIGGRVTDVTGVLTFSRLDLDEMATTAAPPPPRSSTDGRLFSAAPLPFDLLQKFTVDLTARIDKLVLPGGVAVESVNGRAVAKAGRLSVPLTLQAGGGAVRGELKATDARPGNASFDVSGAGIDWGRMLSAPGLIPPVEGSKAELALNLAGNGRSVRDVMGSLNGEARILLGPGRIHNKTLDLVGADAVGQIVGAINPFAKTDETTTLNCAVVRAVVKDGVAVADNGFALETGKMNVTGTGKIDLRRETIDLAFRPQAKEGVGLGNIVGLVRLEGSLSNPSVGIDPLETMKSALGVGAKIATLGLSETAKSLFSGPAGTVAPCQAALGIQPARQQQQQTPSSSTPPRTQKQPAEKSKSIEDRMRGVGEGISKGLKGLLGQ